MSIRVADLPKRLPLSGITDGTGTCRITFKTQGQVGWQVEQITIEMRDAPSGATAALRVNGTLVTDLIPTADAAGGDPPLPMFPGDVGEIEWNDTTPGLQGKALIIYRTASYGR